MAESQETLPYASLEEALLDLNYCMNELHRLGSFDLSDQFALAMLDQPALSLVLQARSHMMLVAHAVKLSDQMHHGRLALSLFEQDLARVPPELHSAHALAEVDGIRLMLHGIAVRLAESKKAGDSTDDNGAAKEDLNGKENLIKRKRRPPTTDYPTVREDLIAMLAKYS